MIPILKTEGNYAVRTLAMDPRHEFNAVAGCPAGWPVAIDFIGDATVSPFQNRIVVSAAQLANTYQTLNASFDTWFANTWQPFVDQRAQTELAARTVDEDELKTVLQNLKTAFQNWSTLTAAQKDTAQKQSIRAIGLLFQLGKVGS
jgi:hypothetical protein